MKDTKATVGIYTLGCKVNQYESEAIAERFTARGFKVLPPHTNCDFYIINTCTVTAESDRKARQMIRRAMAENPRARILVTGCMAQTAADDIARLGGVDYVCGNADKLSVVEAAERLLQRSEKADVPELHIPPLDGACFEPMTITKFDRTRAYIKIEDGCESHCTYCIIPSARGPIRSKPKEDILREAETLIAGGCREIVLTGIETGSYGMDLENTSLADLLEAVDALPGIGRVRLGSLDPAMMKPAFIERVAKLRSPVPHYHLSMQSGSDRILKAMKRKYNVRMAMEHIQKLKDIIPHVMLTTDIIVGFPGETREDFEKTVQFVKDAEFFMVHVFPYSARRGTPAAAMSDQVPMPLRHERVAILSEIAAEIRHSILERQIVQRPLAEVLFEEYHDGLLIGHTPEFIRVKVKSDTDLRGQIASVHLCHVEGDDICAKLL